jgi:2-methylcitrate dehydratase PrpD
MDHPLRKLTRRSLVSAGRSATGELAEYLADFQPTALPERVMSQAKLVTIDAIGNAIGGLPFDLADTFCDLARSVGGGSSEATIIGSADKVSVPYGSFANTALSTMLDYSDWAMSDSGRCPIWIGPLAVPAALAAGEATGVSGAEFFASVAAGYECAARVLHSMDMSVERSLEVNGETLSVFAGVGAAGRALRFVAR